MASRAAPMHAMLVAREAARFAASPTRPELVTRIARPSQPIAQPGAAAVAPPGAHAPRGPRPVPAPALLPGTVAQAPALPVSLPHTAAGTIALPATVVSAAPLPVSDMPAGAAPTRQAARVIAATDVAQRILVSAAAPGIGAAAPAATVAVRRAATESVAPGAPVAVPLQPVQTHAAELPRQPAEELTGRAPTPAEVTPPEGVPTTLPVPILVPATVTREWPALEVLQRLAEPAVPGEPAALQHLRRMPMAQTRPAMQALATLPALGPGEPLPAAVRRPMETLRGQDLAAVRIHTSPAAQPLGAAAFTSGEHIVFAPGRFDAGTPQGLALLGHELAHVGQPLAFKTEPDAGPAFEDAGEREALEQELVVQRLAERGRMEQRAAPPEVRRLVAPQASPPAAPLILRESLVSGGIGSPNLVFQQARLGESGGVQVQRTLVPGTGGELPEREPLTGETPPQVQPETPRAGQAAPDIKELARKVYALLKERLRAEHDRHAFYR